MTVPREPSSDIRQLASVLHQSFVALVAAGFSEEQALRIIAAMLAANGGK